LGKSGGPNPSIQAKALKGDRILSCRHCSRRIGEFLKKLELAEGRFTGIPKMRLALRQNGSLPPRFDTDEGRTFFAVGLLIHLAFVSEVEDEAGVELNETELRVLHALRDAPKGVQGLVTALRLRSAAAFGRHSNDWTTSALLG
jgi:predicted HTH transcriptional regulator